jgi:RNA-binding protein YhbY
MTSQQEVQLGKNGLTKTFLEDLKKRFESRKLENIKISVLKSAREDREDVKKYAKEIIEFLGEKFTSRVIGFSIFIKKWRKARNKI